MEGILEGHRARVRDEDIKAKGYGWREFWRDLFRKEKERVRV